MVGGLKCSAKISTYSDILLMLFMKNVVRQSVKPIISNLWFINFKTVLFTTCAP